MKRILIFFGAAVLLAAVAGAAPTSRAAVKLFFETGDVPTEAQFGTTWDSTAFVQEDETITGGWTFTPLVTFTGGMTGPTLTFTGTGTMNGLDAIDATTEATLEGALELQSLQGAVTDAQVPDTITVDLAAVATTANGVAADSVALTTGTTGDYVASITNGAGITGGDGGSEGAGLTLAATLGTDIVTGEIVDGTLLAVDLDATNAPVDNYIPTYDAGSGGFTWEVDQTAGAPTFDSIGNPAGSSSISFDDGETVAFTAAEDAGEFFSIEDSDTDHSADATMFELRTASDGDTDFHFLRMWDDYEGTPGLMFEVDGQGVVTANSLSLDGAMLVSQVTNSMTVGSGSFGYLRVNDYADNDGVILGQGGVSKWFVRPDAFRPTSDNTMDLGDASRRVRSFYVGTSIDLFGATIAGDGTDDANDGLTLTSQGSGALVLQSGADSTTAIQFLDADGGDPILNVDATNERVGIGLDDPSFPLHVGGSISASTLPYGNPEVRLTPGSTIAGVFIEDELNGYWLAVDNTNEYGLSIREQFSDGATTFVPIQVSGVYLSDTTASAAASFETVGYLRRSTDRILYEDSTDTTQSVAVFSDGLDVFAATTTAELMGVISDEGAGGTYLNGNGTWTTPSGSGAFTADGDTQITASTAIVLDQATGNEVAVDMSYTVNKATSGNDTGIFLDKTDTASPGTSLLMDLQVGAASMFSVDDAGNVTAAGDLTVTGNQTVGNVAATTLEFEGATADAFETTIAVVDPTADRTFTLPNVSGTAITTGDTGTVTGTMILDDTVDSADYAAGSIDNEHLADDAVNSDEIADGAVDAVHLATGSQTDVWIIACSDETTALTTGTGKVKFKAPYAATITDVSASVTTAPTGATLIVDINEEGTTLMTTDKIEIEATEDTSEDATDQPALTDTAVAQWADITIDIDQIGSTVAGAGLKVYITHTH